MVSDSVPAEQAAAETEEASNARNLQVMQMEDISSQGIGEKRKASASSGSDSIGADSVGTRRPAKARIIESKESTEAETNIVEVESTR